MAKTKNKSREEIVLDLIMSINQGHQIISIDQAVELAYNEYDEIKRHEAQSPSVYREETILKLVMSINKGIKEDISATVIVQYAYNQYNMIKKKEKNIRAAEKQFAKIGLQQELPYQPQFPPYNPIIGR